METATPTLALCRARLQSHVNMTAVTLHYILVYEQTLHYVPVHEQYEESTGRELQGPLARVTAAESNVIRCLRSKILVGRAR